MEEKQYNTLAEVLAAITVVISLLCNLLIAFSAFRKELNPAECWIEQMPAEWCIAVTLIVEGLVICLPVKNWWRRIRNWIWKE